MNAPPTIIQNWLTSLADFAFIIEHLPGIKHINADAMSRHSSVLSEVDDSEEESDDATPARRCAATAKWTEQPATSFLPAKDTDIDLAQEQADDPDLGKAMAWVKAGKGPDKLKHTPPHSTRPSLLGPIQ
jgi:hypothetical protein